MLGESGLGKTKLAETLRSHVVGDDGCKYTCIFVIRKNDNGVLTKLFIDDD